MRKAVILSMLAVWIAAGALQADTLYLRDGTEVKGTFIGYESGQFIFETSDGNQTKYLSRRVERLTIDRAEDSRYRRGSRRGTKSIAESSTARWESITPFDVRLEDQWIRSEIELIKGQRVKVEAAGTVMLEGRTAVDPEGLRNRRDSDAPMPNENDGALIAIIGKDPNAPAFLIGRQKEFVADRDGLLYFTVNHWETRNAKGSFRVNVSIYRSADDSAGQMQKRSKVIAVQGNQAWTDTGIDVDSNDIIDITADGTITISSGRRTTPSGDLKFNAKTSKYPIQSIGVGALIAKIRYRNGMDSSLRYVGSSNQMKLGSTQSGRLFIGINDDNLNDNSGAYRVTIRW
ncbi:MAG: hypothetical protein JXA73_22480 [Acidobacteria bacterium]|nr:hypothetical protein [Acidobacteriota bacterium]